LVLFNLLHNFTSPSKKKKDWAGADSFCRGGNMALLKIESWQENDLIYSHFFATPGERLTGKQCLNNGLFNSYPYLTTQLQE
jgi:hypothetical protein